MMEMLNIGCGSHFHPAWTNIDVAPSDPRVISCNVLDQLPFPDGNFSVVYHSHVLEHLPKWAAPAFLAECWRVLCPGGILRVVVPDLETICRVYLKYLDGALVGESGAADRYDWMLMELLDQMVRDESGGEMWRFWHLQPVPAKDFVVERVGTIASDIINQISRKPATAPAPRSVRSPEQIGVFRQSGEVHKWMYDRFSLHRLLKEQRFVDIEVKQAAESAIPDFVDYLLDTQPDGQVRKPDSLFMEAIKPVL